MLENGSFDKMLIIYLRYISYIYVDEVIKLSEQNQGQSEEEKTISKNINKELIITMNIEPNFFIICLMSYLFDVMFFGLIEIYFNVKMALLIL